MMSLGKRAKQNRLNKYIETNFLNDEIIDNNLDNDTPSVKIQTKDRIITLTVTDDGKIIEDFRMRKGAGSKSDYLKKKEAFSYITAYVEKYYKNDLITKESFDDGFIKVQTIDKNLTITYDSKIKDIIVKERMRKGKGKSNSKESNKTNIANTSNKAIIKEPEVVNAKSLKKDTSALLTKESLLDSKTSRSKYKTDNAQKIKDADLIIAAKQSKKKQKIIFKENDIVKNIYSNEQYAVIEDFGGMVEVLKDSVSYQMATADLLLVSKENKKP